LVVIGVMSRQRDQGFGLRHTLVPRRKGSVGWELRWHPFVLRIDIGALGEELVDEAELAEACCEVESGLVSLQWWEGRKVVLKGGRRQERSMK
jgi:hypothetical protein